MVILLSHVFKGECKLKIKQYNTFNLKTVEELGRFSSIIFADIIRAVNGNLSFEDNINTKRIDVSFTAANTDTLVNHNLGRIPQGYILIKSNAATSIYDGSLESTEQLIYLKASAISEATILIF